MDLNTVWFVLFMVLLAGYAVLDGFDLGVGVLHLLAKSDEERDVHVNAIGPVWDGNEVWLITAGGALFAAFPLVYATVFSGFYLALMLVLLALIARAVSMEFRHAHHHPTWVRVFDWTFGLGSLLPPVLFGVAVGNVVLGVPIEAEATWAGTFLGLLNPFSLLVGVLTLSMFLLHGALYLRLKSEGPLEQRMTHLVPKLFLVCLVLLVVTAVYVNAALPHLLTRAGEPLQLLTLVLLVASLVGVLVFHNKPRPGYALLSSAGAIVSLIAGTAIAMYPTLVFSSIHPGFSLTIYNASSSEKTLFTMMLIALIGMPMVVTYTIAIYRIFKGKAKSHGGYAISPSNPTGH